MKKNKESVFNNQIHFQTTIAIVFAFIILLITWYSVQKSKQDSLQLLTVQGRAFTEALAQASDNAIKSESFFDYLVEKRYSDLVLSLEELNINIISEQELSRFRISHDLLGLLVFDSSGELEMSSQAKTRTNILPEFLSQEVEDLFLDNSMNFVLLTDQESDQLYPVHYYLEKGSSLERVIVLVIDALYYEDAIRQTGIGYLAQKMAQENGVEYILYQTTDGIIFASEKPGEILAIESDPFLNDILQTDSAGMRMIEFQREEVLEVVKPFSSENYPFGLFRVGFSLESYHDVSRSLTIQLFALALILLLLLLVLLLYLNSRFKRAEIGKKYSTMKSLTDQIFDQMQTGVAAVDHFQRFCLTNDAFQKIMALPNIIGEEWQSTLPEDLVKKITSKKEGIRQGELELELKIGNQKKQLLFVWSETNIEKSDTSALVIVVTDVSELREYQLLSGRKERLSEMGELAAGVAHEIRNPLNAIAIAAQRLSSEFTPNENINEYGSFTAQIRKETKRLNEIITRFLALSKVRSNVKTSIDLTQFILDVRELLSLESKNLRIDLKVKVEDELRIKGDINRLKELFFNLFTNAKEALSDSKRIISIEVIRNNNLIQILFSDSGCGISPDDYEKVFKPYYTTKDTGTGLGLPTVHQIVDEFSGDIQISDSQFGGATFKITLPSIPA